MKNIHHSNLQRIVLIAPIIISLAIIFSCTTKNGTKDSDISYSIYGGPQGGTFRVFAKGISRLAKNKGISLRPVTSKGSFENVRRVDSNKANFAIAYASHVYMARQGRLPNDPKKYENIMVLGYFYGAPAQLFVNKKLGITSAYQLELKKISVGNVGSGAFYQAKIFFTQLGIWDQLDRKNMGYNDATKAFLKRELDACWLFTAYPSGAVIDASLGSEIDLLHVYDDGQKAHLFQKHPYFTKTIIPGDTYKGVLHETRTFQDSALWIDHKDVPENIVYQLLEEVYSEKGKAHLLSLKKTAKMMVDNDGSFGISTPLHPGAVKYYREQQ